MAWRSEALVLEEIERILRTEDWDTISVKLVLKKLEQKLAHGAEGSLRPHKKLVKAAVDEAMARILAEGARQSDPASAGVGAEGDRVEGGPAPTIQDAPPHAADSHEEATPSEQKAEEEGWNGVEQPVRQQRTTDEERTTGEERPTEEVRSTVIEQPLGEPVTSADKPVDTQAEVEGHVEAPAALAVQEDMASAPPDEEASTHADSPAHKRRRLVAIDDDDDDEKGPETTSAPATAADGSKEEKTADDDDEDEGDEDEDEEEEADADAAVVLDKAIRKADGKLFYSQMKKQGETYSVGQDVYLENGREAPYVARLQEIFTYAFAPSEVYFNARWYYRKDDVHDYAKLAGATFDVKFEGATLEAAPKELFFSLHLDENHSDCVLRPCNVHLREDRDSARSLADSLTSQHEYFAWRAYDNKAVYALDSLPSKRLRDAFSLESKRGPAAAEATRERERLARERDRLRREEDEAERAPLSNDELRALTMPRKHAEVWVDTQVMGKVAIGCLVRAMQRLNGVKSFYVGLIVATKRAMRPYKLGKKEVDVNLQLRTAVGLRLAGLDTLSNEPPTDIELERFRVPLSAPEVRRKLREMQERMSEHAELFDSAEVVRKAEEEERLRLAREAQFAAERQAEEERERREREREELRRRAADKAAGGADNVEQWWLRYNVTRGDSSGREIAKWKARLSRFTKIVKSSTSSGERENAQRLAEQARQKIEQLQGEGGEAELETDRSSSGLPNEKQEEANSVPTPMEE